VQIDGPAAGLQPGWPAELRLARFLPHEASDAGWRAQQRAAEGSARRNRLWPLADLGDDMIGASALPLRKQRCGGEKENGPAILDCGGLVVHACSHQYRFMVVDKWVLGRRPVHFATIIKLKQTLMWMGATGEIAKRLSFWGSYCSADSEGIEQEGLECH
jgi:hypothetical protein